MIKSMDLKTTDFLISFDNNNASRSLNTQLGIPNDYEFRIQTIKGKRDQIRETDELGYVHERYTQYYKNIEVEHSDVRLRFLNNSFHSVNGEYIDVPTIDISVVISKEAAIQKAKKYVGATKYVWEDERACEWLRSNIENISISCYPDPEIVIYRNRFIPEDTLFYVAYKVEIRAIEPLSHDYIYVNAKSGDILNSISNIYYDRGRSGIAETRYSDTQSISTLYYIPFTIPPGGKDPYFTLIDNTRKIETWNLKINGQYWHHWHYKVHFKDDDDFWSAQEHKNSHKDDGALDAHWGAMMTYDYFKEVHNRNSFDNNGKIIYNAVHYSIGDQAFWMDDRAYYCDGYYCDIMTTLDIVAHEIGHGVCNYSAQLVYQGEPGAISESLSDIWGACVKDYVALGKNIWITSVDNNCRMRSMSNPKTYNHPNTYQGQYWGDPNSSYDYGYVHTNSGVMNHWFYILSVGKSGTNDNGSVYNVAGIGIDKAAKIVYRAQTTKMTKLTNYPNARIHTINAAIELFGEDCDEVISVMNAWYAVGVGNQYDCTKYITNKNYNSGTHNIDGCKVVVSNTSIKNLATVNILAEESVIINYDFHAAAGSKVTISIGDIPPCSPSALLQNNITTNNDEAPNFQMVTENYGNNVMYELGFKLYPNPNNGTFQLDANFPLTDIGNLRIINLLGTTVYETQNFSSNTIQLQTSATGTFFVVIILKEGTVLTQKMMIQR
ncbi:MAG: M4 family metallopeptidase [Bacteroidetes bacterium]|nr:M4 family metallopeptidase [Bacteroidota bacterium]MCL2303404.1 M4 family metallopeptidase [Lentimicrobiaceae bacterium]